MSSNDKERPYLNILEYPWMQTIDGLKSPKDVISNNIDLTKAVSGYTYGAQFRFLLTIVPLIVKEELKTDEDYLEDGYGEFRQESIDTVFEKLKDYSDLFSEARPFLQVNNSLMDPTIDGKIVEPSTPPTKLLPEGQSTVDRQAKFWNFNKVEETLDMSSAILALVCFYFYGTGTNTVLSKGNKKLMLFNGSSALKYLSSTEIIPAGEDLIKTLLLSTPTRFLESKSGNLLPHWADRDCKVMSIDDPLWAFSWSSNTVNLKFSEDYKSLKLITRGGNPHIWNNFMPLVDKEKYPKKYHEKRQENDPLYFHRINKQGEIKLWRPNLSTDPYYSVTQWHYERLQTILSNKFKNNCLRTSEYMIDMIFLEHATEGAANSFAIRHSKVLTGWKDELLTDFPDVDLAGSASNVMLMKSKLSGMFTENGTCKNLHLRKNDVENYFWGECQDLIIDILHKNIDEKEVKKRLTKAAIDSFEKVSNKRDTVNFESHVKGLSIIKGVFKEKYVG